LLKSLRVEDFRREKKKNKDADSWFDGRDKET